MCFRTGSAAGWRDRSRGQPQKGFLPRSEAEKEEIDIHRPAANAHAPEFDAWRRERLERLPPRRSFQAARLRTSGRRFRAARGAGLGRSGTVRLADAAARHRFGDGRTDIERQRIGRATPRRRDARRAAIAG